MELLGIIMLAAPFIGFFFFTAYSEGVTEAFYVFGSTAFFLVWVVAAINLIYNTQG